MNVVYFVAHVPGHCADHSTPQTAESFLVKPIGICSTERMAWDQCKADGRHGTAYAIIEVDRQYAENEVAKGVYPNCPCNSHRQPKPAGTVEVVA